MLEGKVAIVTGASKGIGAGIAKDMAGKGAAVVVNYNGDKDGAFEVVSAIEKAGGRAVAVKADVSNPDDVERLFNEAEKAFGKVSVLVNNAGVFRFMPVEAVSVEEYRRQFDPNVFSVLLTTQAAVKRFDKGVIINVASSGVRAPMPIAGLYIATKAAVIALTQANAKQLGPRGIRVNALAPGATMTEGAKALDFPQAALDHMVAMTPLGRIGQPDDIGPVASFLASDAAKWITGEVLFASGGA